MMRQEKTQMLTFNYALNLALTFVCHFAVTFLGLLAFAIVVTFLGEI